MKMPATDVMLDNYKLSNDSIGIPSGIANSAQRGEKKNGLSDVLVRFSVGIEDAEDLISDLEQQLVRFA